jgi:AAHS family 4-hydroxybenzoate transporter-like MFS transporter
MGFGTGSASVAELFRAERTLGTLVLWFAVIFNLIVNYAMQNWLTTLLVQVGHSQNTAIAATTLLNAGGILSGFIVGPLMDRFGAYRIMSGLFVACAMCVVMVGAALTAPAALLLASSFCAGFCSNGLQKSAGALAIYFYPPALRSTGVGWTFGVGRVGAILGPLTVGALLALAWAPSRMFDVAALPMLLGAGAVALMGWRYRSGRADRAPPHEMPALRTEP